MTKPRPVLILLCSLGALLATSPRLSAGELDRCGQYIVKGDVEADHVRSEAVIRIRKKSQTEYRVKVALPEKGGELALYHRKKIQTKVAITGVAKDGTAVAKSVGEILLLPHPNENKRDIELLRTEKCE